MFELTLENQKGEAITLTHREGDYQIINVEGLNPPNAIISNSTIVNMDGAKFVSSRLNTRNIVITVKINGNVSANRNFLYNYAKTKQYCKMRYTSNERDVFAEGYIDTIECSLFTNNQTMQISIVCPDPYLQSAYEIFNDISKLLAMFYFPFAFGADGIVANTTTDDAWIFSQYDENRIVSINNPGAETGFTISFTIMGGAVTNPIIYDVYTREFFALDTTLQDQDIVTINTNRGQKSVKLTRAGVVSNIVNYLRANSTWLQLRTGDNMYTYDVDSGNQYMFANFTYRTRYEGV